MTSKLAGQILVRVPIKFNHSTEALYLHRRTSSLKQCLIQLMVTELGGVLEEAYGPDN
jgi:hypothetical protein